MSHVTYGWVVSHIWESCHTYEWGRSVSSAYAVPQSYHRYEKVMSPRINSHVTYDWLTSRMDVSCHTRVNHVTHMNGVKVVLPRMQCLGHITDMTESCRHILKVMSHVNEWHHVWMSRVTREWIMLHIWMGAKWFSSACSASEMSHVWKGHVATY